jgi:GNAT superfamily N-acetyltransferase
MNPNLIRDLGDGLILRRATPEDTEKLVAFHADVHRDPGREEPEEYVGAWTRDLLERPHPTFQPGDFTLVEDMDSSAIVSSLCLISQAWSYGGVEFGVGRPELVGTHPDYRNRGLIRAQFEVIHEWSAARGELVQAITGIPYYYRQFGYEMAMTLGGARSGYKPQVPKLKEGEEEPYRVRPATEADLPFIAEVYAHGSQRYPVACQRDAALWQHELAGKSKKNVNRRDLVVVETVAGEPVGFLAHSARIWKGAVGIAVYELQPGVSWLAVTPSVARFLWALGEDWAARDQDQEMERFHFWLGAEHPAYDVFRNGLPHESKPYAWYLRVPDLPGFVRHIAPVLERRLAASPLVGHTGELHISFYRSGLRLAFEGGRLVGVEPWQPTVEKGGEAAFPGLTFLQLLFGYRSLAELDAAFADCWASRDEARELLQALFPKQPSDVWPVS